MKKMIFIVFGETGEYSDHRSWNIAAYLDESNAQLHALQANEIVSESRKWNYDQRQKAVNQFDPSMQVDYTGTTYGVESVRIYDSLGEFRADQAKGGAA